VKPRIGISGYPRVVDTVLGPTLLHTATRFYVDSVVRAGGTPLVLPALGAGVVDDMLDALDGVVLTGGGDVAPARYGATPSPEVHNVDPLRDEFDLALVCRALERDIPVLAICRGMQVVNVALGGSLAQHIDDHQVLDDPGAPVHEVRIDPDSDLAAALGVTSLEVNSMHHQAVLEPAPPLKAVAWAHDGSVEAVEQPGNRHLVAVQWHPEVMEQPVQQGLFTQLVGAATSRSS
jgi:gamma-glutamyl-gamma-aminobutyrate hydrolase PuuD